GTSEISRAAPPPGRTPAPADSPTPARSPAPIPAWCPWIPVPAGSCGIAVLACVLPVGRSQVFGTQLAPVEKIVPGVLCFEALRLFLSAGREEHFAVLFHVLVVSIAGVHLGFAGEDQHLGRI